MWKLNLFLLGAFLLQPELQAQTLACAKLQETPLPGASCCEGLKLNSSTGLCEDPIRDAALVYCQTTADCGTSLPGQGKGCFRMSEDDLFNHEAQNPNQFTAISDQQDTVDDDRDANPNDEPLADGEACKRSSDCDSYFCDPSTYKCVEKKICRLADIGEAPGPGVRCEEGYIVNAQGLCDLSEQDKQLAFLGLIEGDVTVKTQNKCDLREYQTDPQMKEVREKAIVSMKTLRAMEWLFATSSLDESEECLKVLPFLREEMAKKFAGERKTILNNFNVEMAKIEADYKVLEAAKEGSTNTITIHGEAIKEGDLATRRTSGYDAMKLMWRRNFLFQSFEKAMAEITQAAAAQMGGLADEMGNWKDKGKKWTVGGKEWTAKTAGKCRGKKAKKIRKRWFAYYQVNATSTENKSIVEKEAIANYLTLVSGDSEEAVKNLVTKGPKFTKFNNYFLVDPLMPGGTDFAAFGSGAGNKRQLSATAYPELYKKFRMGLQDYFKGMKGAGAPATGFIYEPEIITAEARDCYDKPEGVKCDEYNKFLDEMTDIAFAQFISYSMHSRNSYKKYFPRGDSMRRKLLAKYESDMQNVVKYYESMAGAREEQTKCLEASMNNVVETILDDGPGVETDGPSSTDSSPTAAVVGVSTSSAGSSAVANKSGAKASAGSSVAPSVRTLRVSENSRGKFQTNLRTGALTALSSASMRDNMASSTPVGGAVFSNGANTRQFAARFVGLKAANAKAKAVGINLAAKEKNTLPALKKLSSSSASPLANAPKMASLDLTGAKAAELELVPKNLQKAGEEQLKKEVTELRGVTPSAVTSPAVSAGLTVGAPVSVSSNPGGLSEADQENIEANYERTRGEYASDEEDELFSKVSKAYVRNLDKILTRKKKLEE